jgi:hypothetical protein
MHWVRWAFGMRRFASADSNGRTGCNCLGGGGGLFLGRSFVVIVSSTGIFRNQIKQLSEPHERTSIDDGLPSSPDRRANDLVEHPTGYAPGRPVREYDVNQITLTAGTPKDFELLAEKRMERVQDSCGFR